MIKLTNIEKLISNIYIRTIQLNEYDLALVLYYTLSKASQDANITVEQYKYLSKAFENIIQYRKEKTFN